MGLPVDYISLFRMYLESDPSLSRYFSDCFHAVVVVGTSRGICISGYYQEAYEELSRDPVAFEAWEDYFSDTGFHRLYAWEAAKLDSFILAMVRGIYTVAGLPEPSVQDLDRRISNLNMQGYFL